MEFGQKHYTSKMDPARRLLKLWEYSKVSQQKGELKVKKKVLVLHYSFHHLKLVWTRWCSWWQGHHSEMMLMCLPSETPKWTGPIHWSCISVSGWWTCAHGLGLTQLPLLGLGQGTAFWTKVVEEGEWSSCVMDAGYFLGSCPWEWLGRRGGTTRAELGSLGEDAVFWGDSAMTWSAAQHPACLTEIRTLQRCGQRAARLGAPQGCSWTGTAGCSSNTTDSQPSLEIG